MESLLAGHEAVGDIAPLENEPARMASGVCWRGPATNFHEFYKIHVSRVGLCQVVCFLR